MAGDCAANAATVLQGNGAAERSPRSLFGERLMAPRENAPSPSKVDTRNIDRCSPPLAARDPATIVVVGPGRSGTTMTVGVLQRLGVQFGDGIDTLGEDRELNELAHAFVRRSIAWRLPAARRQFRLALAGRRNRWGSFGFKTPHIGRSLPLMADLIDNPVYVFVVRNPFHIARSWKKTHGHHLFPTLPKIMLTQYITAAFLSRTKRPVVTFCYEDAVAEPQAVLPELADALGLQPSETSLREAINFVTPSRGYRDTRRFIGQIDLVTDERIYGWISDLNHPDAPVTIDISVAGTRVAGGLADGYRSDIAAIGYHGSGFCGFEQALARPLSKAERDAITITVREGDHVFQFALDGRGRLAILPSQSPLRGITA